MNEPSIDHGTAEAPPVITLDWTSRQQARASDPAASAWVAANAGSGKTHVLSQRVIRLLLNGAKPSAVLCLTYTKAAASEMANRVFARLAAWTRLGEAELLRELEALDGVSPSRERCIRARQLFAMALETPGGLKIQTIHAFCEAVLHQFPLEANVAGHFAVMDDGDTALLMAEARRQLLSATTSEDEAQLARAFETVLSAAGEDGLARLLDDLVAKRADIAAFTAKAASKGGVAKALFTATGLPDAITEDEIKAEAWPLSPMPEMLITDYRMLAESGTAATPKKYAAGLAAIAALTDPLERFDALARFFLKADGLPRKFGNAGAGGLSGSLPDIQERMDAAVAHFDAINDRLKTLRSVEASLAALTLASRLIRDYERLKRQRGKLDFDDLIARTAALLARPGAGAWVHYKLDQGIDHILIDEAQDTSPPQWQIIGHLANEFFAGANVNRPARTVFAVGDAKQSIYSFQGAEPERFRSEGRTFGARATAVLAPFESVELKLSFRSAKGVLQAVDRVFADPDARRGLGAEPVLHESVRGKEPGRVDVWSMIPKLARDDDTDWTAPFDDTPESDPKAVLARRVASTIRDMIDNGHRVEKGSRVALRAADILVLVRKRDGFVNALTRALKQTPAVPVAGADRLVLTDHIAVKDLMALGRVVCMPDDDLSLAALLKSPLFDLDEDALFALCHHRDKGEAVYDALARRGAAEEPVFADAHAKLTRYRALARRLSVFDFFAETLGPLGGRRAFLARLGSEAGDVLDAFIDFALEHDTGGLPGMQSFLAVLEDQSPTIKRELDQARDEVRIMTVHASKGLEAPIVFLVDSGGEAVRGQQIDRLRKLPVPGLDGPGLLWVPGKPYETRVSQSLKDALTESGEEEYRRLLYVGMTRAADRLIVCGYHGLREPTQPHWLAMVRDALGAAPEAREETYSDGQSEWTGWRFSAGDDEGHAFAPELADDDEEIDGDPPLHPLPPPARPPRPLMPSGAAAVIDAVEPPPTARSPFAALLDPIAVSDDRVGHALQRGRIMHRFFELLPDMAPAERYAACMRYLARAASDWSEQERVSLIQTVLGILDDPLFAPVFAPGSRAELSVMGTVALGEKAHVVAGRIDRLATTENRVLIIDFKTNRPPILTVEDVPPVYVAQMALYRALISPLYPGRTVEAALLFTEAPALIVLSDAALDRALADLTTK